MANLEGEDGKGQADPAPASASAVTSVVSVWPKLPEPSWGEDGPLVAVYPKEFVRGVYGPGPDPEPGVRRVTDDWRERRYSDGNTRAVDACGEVVSLHEALTRDWPHDGFATRYVLRGPDGAWLRRQPRLNKDGLPWLLAQGYTVWCSILLVDVDNPDHAHWTLPMLEAFWELYTRGVPLLGTATIYMTRGGWRIVQLLSRPVPLHACEPLSVLHMAGLERAGIAPDNKCRDWTRFFRLPRTVRDGARFDRDVLTWGRALMPEEVAALAGTAPILRKPKVEHRPDVTADFYAPGSSPSSFMAPRWSRARPTRWVKSEAVSDLVLLAPPPDDPNRAEDVEEGVEAFEHTVPEQMSGGTGNPRRADFAGRFDPTVSARWRPLLAPLVAATNRPGVVPAKSSGHNFFMHLAGALLSFEMPHEQVQPFICDLAYLAWPGDEQRQQMAERIAKETATKHARGGRVTGYATLRREYQPVADALALAMNSPLLVRAQEDAERYAALPALEPLAATRAGLPNMIVGAAGSEGVTAISAACGVGKSYGCEDAAIRLASSADDTTGEKTVFSFDKNLLAVQAARDLVALGVARGTNATVKRLRGPASVLDAAGMPVCRFHDAAEALAAGGQSVHQELCEGRQQSPCIYKDRCRAYGSYEGDEAARIVVGSHAKLSQLRKEAGRKLVVIDEPPSPLSTIEIAEGDQKCVAAMMLDRAFRRHFVAAMQPAVDALFAWVAAQSEDAPRNLTLVTLVHALEAGADAVAPKVLQDARGVLSMVGGTALDVILAGVRGAFPPRPAGTPGRAQAVGVPPMTRAAAFRARGQGSWARTLGRASAVYTAIWDAVVTRHDGQLPPMRQAYVRVTFDAPDAALRAPRTLLITAAHLELLATLERPHPTVLLDASIEVHLPVLAHLLGTPAEPWAPQYGPFAFDAADSVPVERTLLYDTRATRRGWISGGRPMWGSSLYPAFQRVLHWLRSNPNAKKVCFVTFKKIAVALRAALWPHDPRHAQEWLAMDLSARDLEKSVTNLRAVLTDWSGSWIVSHYGAVRGLNSAKSADSFVTFGDPFPDVDSLRAECALVQIQDTDARMRLIAESELYQALERARSVDRAEYGACRMLHYGQVRPGGREWLSPAVRRLEVGMGRLEKPRSTVTGTQLQAMREEIGLTQAQVGRALRESCDSVKREEARKLVSSAFMTAFMLLYERERTLPDIG